MSQYTYKQSKPLRRLRKAIFNRPPYCSGTVPVETDELSFYYGVGEEARQIQFGAATDDALKHLAETCRPATFGHDDEDVLDESYRKAGDLDNTKFAVKLKLDENSLMDMVRTHLLEGRDCERKIYAELYKLNVYGQGSFFKSHKDTPRDETMFGSLVVIYPTRHEGGSLIFREGKDTWTFDSAQAVATSTLESPCVGYAAFFSDLDHEVSLVEAGYRVTITYNLYFNDDDGDDDDDDDDDDQRPQSVSEDEQNKLKFRSTLEHLLADPTFLPNGGRLGFGLHRVYPLAKKPSGRDALVYLRKHLKGSDAEILRACEALSLPAKLYLVYRHYGETGLVAREPEIYPQNFVDDMNILEYLVEECGVKVKRVNDFTSTSTYNEDVSSNEDESDEDENDTEGEDTSSAVGDEKSGRDDGKDSVSDDSLQQEDGDSSDSSKSKRDKDDIDCIIHWVTMPSAMNALEKPVVYYGNEPSLLYTYGFVTLIVEVGKPGKRVARAE